MGKVGHATVNHSDNINDISKLLTLPPALGRRLHHKPGAIEIIISNSIERFKTRLLTAYRDQAVAMREEGISLAAINNGATLAGFSSSPLIRTEDSGLNPNLSNSCAPFQIQDIKDRLLFILAIEAVHSLEGGVPTYVCEANIYSLREAGYPAWTGGVLQFINQYDLPAFTARARELAQQFGSPFSPPDRLVKMAENGLIFRDRFSA